MPATAIEVPYHYEHAPRVAQGVRVEGANNWYLGANRTASPIVVLREAPALVLDENGRVARREWDALPGSAWDTLAAKAPAPVQRSAQLTEPAPPAPSSEDRRGVTETAGPPKPDKSVEPEWRRRKSAHDPLSPVAEK